MRAAIRQILFGDMPFSPSRLFAAGEQGVWYDPSDFSTMFQDSAGTTPVTAIEQPVGLILDKSGRGNHASQSTTTSRPILKQDETGRYFLDFDGTDDWLQTGNINFSATDKMSVFAGVRKFSATTGFVFETSVSWNINPGAFVMASSGITDNDYTVNTNATYTTSGKRTGYSMTSYPVPTTNVISVNLDMSKTARRDVVKPRINGIIPTLTNVLDNTITPANYGNYPLYIGRRADTTFALTGRIYSLIIRGALTSSPQLEQTERWVNGKTGAY